MGIIAWVVLGLIAGALAKLIYPGPQGGGVFATIGLGILGALVGGYVGQAVFGVGGSAMHGNINVPSVIFATLGAVLIIFLWGLITRRKT